MSYDISTYIEIDGERILCQEAGNMTWNVNVMYYLALESSQNISLGANKSLFYLWNGKNAHLVLPQVEGIIVQMTDYPEKYKALEPDNGWGTYDGALAWMHQIRLAILKSPKNAIIAVC